MVSSLLSLAALLGIGTALTKYRASTQESAAQTAFPPQGDFFDVDGIKMHALVQGSGPDLVLIHGSSGSTRDFTQTLMPELAKRYRVIAVDRPGLGYSQDHPDAVNLSTQAKLIQNVAHQLGADKPIVLGQSYGGAVALAWAAHLPDTLSALVPVSSPSYPWKSGLGAYYSVLSHPLGLRFVIPLITAYVPDGTVAREIDEVFTPQHAPAGYIEHLGARVSLRRRNMRANARQRRVLLEQVLKLFMHYPQINIPVEILHGTADTIVSAKIHSEILVKEIQNANLTLLDNIGHMPHHVAIPEVIAAIDRAALRAGLK